MGETTGDGTGGGALPDVAWMTERLVLHILENVRPDAERAAVQQCVFSFMGGPIALSRLNLFSINTTTTM